MDEIKIEIADLTRINIAEDEILLVKLPERYRGSETQISRKLNMMFPKMRILVSPSDIEFQAIKQEGETK